jgi:hypothetical protein
MGSGDDTKIVETLSSPVPTFSNNERYLAFLLIRGSSSLEKPINGLFLYGIQSGMLLDVFPLAVQVGEFRFSKSASQFVLAAQFDDLPLAGFQVVAIRANGNDAALLSTPGEVNRTPRFIP